MLLTFDVGNTHTVVGCFQGKNLLRELRFTSDVKRTEDEYSSLLFSLLERHLGPDLKFTACVISSVVPPITLDLARFVKQQLMLEPLIVGPGTRTGLTIKISEPASVGADRVVNAVAVKALFGSPALVIDFGTATSFDYVSAAGNYEGGIIAPGVNTALEALVRATAKLPRIELAWPDKVIGKGTVQAMQSGSVLGYLCMVDGLIEKVEEEVGQIQYIVATGGLGKLYAAHSKRIQRYEPHLTLIGMRLIAELNGLVSN